MTVSREGAGVLCETLERAGARHVFGLPGTPAVPLFEGLRKSDLRVVLATNETAAGFMANGYARVSGEVGILVTSPGPGFSYAIPALAEARLDSAPVLHVAVKAAGLPGRRFRHQEIPEAAMVRELVKEVVEVDRIGAVAEAAARAHARALNGEPGPVVLRVSEAALEDSSVEGLQGGGRSRVVPGEEDRGSEEIPPDLLERVRAARRPVIYAGAGALEATARLRELAHEWPVPVLTTPSARGIVPEDDGWSLAFDPVGGGLEAVNRMLGEADLVLALGCKFSHGGSAGFGLVLEPESLAHVNTDAAALGAEYPAAWPVHGRVGPVLDALLETVGGAGTGRSAWTAAEVARRRSAIREAPAPDPAEPVIRGAEDGEPARFFAALRDAIPREGVLVTDSGLHGVLARRHYQVRAPVGLVGPTDFASMGFGLPAAIGAALAVPDRPVAAILGDGGLAISAMELLTATREGLALPVVVFNDGHLNLIRLQQIRGYGRTHAVDLQEPDLEGLAGALGAAYRRWEREGADAVRGAFRRDRPTVIEVAVDDSAGIRAARVRGAARASVRDLVGPERIARLRRLFGTG